MVEEIAPGIHYGKGSGVLTVMDARPTTISSKSLIANTTNAISFQHDKKALKLSPWGHSNQFPQLVKAESSCSPVLSRAIAKKIKIHFGKGVIPYKIEENNGERKLRVTNEETVNFFNKNKVDLRATHFISDYEWFNNFFVEYILSNDYNNINKINHLEASYTRLCTSDNDEMRPMYGIYSKKFGENKMPSKSERALLHIIDPFWSAEKIKEYCKKRKIKKFTIPYRSAMPGNDYYTEAAWNSVRKSGWLSIALLIPRVKHAVIKNSMVIKYIVKIPRDYWKKKYPEIDYKDPEVRKGKVNEDLKSLDDFLKDYKNTGSNFVTYYDLDPISKKQSGTWEVEAVDTKYQDGVLNLDSAAANSELLFGVGIDPSIIGAGMPGKELGAKSGSDKREAYNMATIDAHLDRVYTTEYLRLVRDWNGWDKEIEFGYLDDVITTLDKNPTGVQKANI